MIHSWQDTVWFLDVDDTILNTDGAHDYGAKLAQQHLSRGIDPQDAEKIIALFNKKYWFIRQGYSAKDPADWEKIPGGQAAYEVLLDQIRSYQPEVIKKFGAAKLWSREVLLKLCADELRIELAGSMAEDAAAAFWEGVAQKSAVLPDAQALIAEIKRRGRSVHLFTSSDGHLSYNQPRQTFTYDPDRSRQQKIQRIERYRDQGLTYDTLTTGDPLDKPALSGFQSMLLAAEEYQHRPVEPQCCIMIGDSYQGDLAVPHDQLGFGLCVWYRRKISWAGLD